MPNKPSSLTETMSRVMFGNLPVSTNLGVFNKATKLSPMLAPVFQITRFVAVDSLLFFYILFSTSSKDDMSLVRNRVLTGGIENGSPSKVTDSPKKSSIMWRVANFIRDSLAWNNAHHQHDSGDDNDEVNGDEKTAVLIEQSTIESPNLHRRHHQVVEQ